jgi:hypothetical protein
MPKAKKSDLEKAAKPKSSKSPKAEKPAKEKKDKKKAKVAPAAPAPVPAKKSAAAKPKKVVAPEIVLTTEEISLRAYFIAERRQAMGWPGDSAHDWVEAERQLKAEAKRKAQKK